MAIDSDQELKTPTVLLLGASSQIGVFAIPQLILTGFDVIAVSRKGKPEGYPVFAQVKWLSEADALKVAHSCEYLLSTGPLELAKTFIESPDPQINPVTPHATPVTPDVAPVTPGLTRGPFPGHEQQSKMDSGSSPERQRGPFQTAVIFSSSSVESKRNSNNPNERTQVKDMLGLESELQLLAENSSTNLVIFRPTLIYGCGLDTNISRLAKWIRQYGFMPINGKAAGLRQPVHAQDLASIAINTLLSNKDLADVMFLGGGETLSYSDMVERIFNAMNKPVRMIRLPQWLFMLLVRFANFFKMGQGINGEMVKRQQVDLVFDDQQARELLNYRPRSFSPAAEDFSLPDFENIET